MKLNEIILQQPDYIAKELCNTGRWALDSETGKIRWWCDLAKDWFDLVSENQEKIEHSWKGK